MAFTQIQRIILTLGLIVSGQSIIAQLGPKEVSWNYIPKEHIEMTDYTFDKNADAVILHDMGIWAPISLENSQVRQQRHTRIKILKESGSRFKDVAIEYKASEKIVGLKARTINWEDGKRKVEKLDLKYLPEEKLKNKMKRKSFRFRNVKPGSIIEYQYTLHTKDMEWLKNWYFQNEIPTVHSEVRVDNFRVEFYSVYPQVLEVKSYLRGRYQMRHVAALPKQPLIQNWNDHRAGVRFQLKDGFELRSEQREWELITLDFQQGTLFLDDSVTTNALFSLTQSIIREAITDEEKVALIYNHVREKIKWNQKSDIWMTKTPSQTYKDQKGSSVEINMLLTQLLWLADIKAYRLFYRTRDKGVPIFAPIRNQLNDMLCIAQADGQNFFLDATDPIRPYELIPKRALNIMGWLVKDSTATWVKIPKTYAGSTSAVAWLTVNEAGNVNGEVKEIYAGYAGLELKKKINKETEASFVKKQVKSEPETYDLKGIKEADVPVTFEYIISESNYAHKEGKEIIIYPLLHFKESENLLTAPTRYYPIDFEYKKEKTFFLNYLIPEGYTVKELPKSSRVKTMDDSFIYEFVTSHSGQTIQIKSTITIDKPVFGTEDYSALKELFQKIMVKQNEKMVLVPTQ